MGAGPNAGKSPEKLDDTLNAHLGVYRSSKGAKGELDLQDGIGLVFRSRGKVPWESKVSWLQSTDKGNVYILPDHPLSSKAQGLGMCMLHRPGDTVVKEYAGNISANPSALWTWQRPLATATGAAELDEAANPPAQEAFVPKTRVTKPDANATEDAERNAAVQAGHSTAGSPPSVAAASATATEPGCSTTASSASPPSAIAAGAAPAPSSDIASRGVAPAPPAKTMASAESKPSQAKAQDAGSCRKWLIEEVIKARKTVEDACEIAKQLAIEVAPGLKSEPDVPCLGDLSSDLGEMSESQLQKELDRLDMLHQDLKDSSDSFLGFRRKASSMLLRDEESDSTDVARLLGPTNECGLGWDRRWQDLPSGPEEEVTRDKVRYGTRDKVAIELGLPDFGYPASAAQKQPPYCNEVRLICDSSPLSKQGSAQPGGVNLLGRYDAVCVRARADFDRNFRFISTDKRKFWVLHAAAINIGESRKAADFADFSKRGVLDEDAYVAAMGHIAVNVVKVAVALNVEEFIFFPFGLGAFLRHLGLLDARFKDDVAMQQLRRRVTKSFVEAFVASPPSLKVHLCISFQEAEAQENADAFLRAFDAANADLKKRTTIWPDGDCLQLAHEMALKSRHVMLVNGANRQAIGNHWFARHAKRAIDENLHRRSWTLSAISYLLNRFGEEGTSSRKPTELRDRVKDIGGAVFCFKGNGISAESGDECVCS